jgi:hypothetical protein
MMPTYQLQLAEQYQRDLRNEAEKWRLSQSKETHQPKRMSRRNKRKRQY